MIHMIKFTSHRALTLAVLAANGYVVADAAQLFAADPIHANPIDPLPAIAATSTATEIGMPPRMVVLGSPSS